MPRPIERRDDELRDFLSESLGNFPDVMRDRRVEIYDISRLRSDRELLHIRISRVIKIAARSCRDDSERIRKTIGDRGRTLQRIHSNVEYLTFSFSQLFADI